MKKITLALLAGLLFVGLLSFAAQQAFAQAVHNSQTFNIPPGNQRVIFDAGPAPSLPFVLRFIMGGHPGLKIARILSRTGWPEFSFPEGVSPFEVTVFFVQNPARVESTGYDITIENTTDKDQVLEIVSISLPLD